MCRAADPVQNANAAETHTHTHQYLQCSHNRVIKSDTRSRFRLGWWYTNTLLIFTIR